MLAMPKVNRHPIRTTLLCIIGLILIASGIYLLVIATAPTLTVLIPQQPIDSTTLPKPAVNDDRIIIPSINVNIPYGTDGQAALDRGAWWRYPDRGNPTDGGNFIIAAHRFSIQPTPQETIKKSPFYHIEKLTDGDTILIDYKGKRYGYTITKRYTVAPSQVEIEAKSDTPKLTMYSCTLEGSTDGRIVFEAKPMGEVSVE